MQPRNYSRNAFGIIYAILPQMRGGNAAHHSRYIDVAFPGYGNGRRQGVGRRLQEQYGYYHFYHSGRKDSGCGTYISAD